MNDLPAPFELVESYVLGEMNQEESHAFELRLRDEPSLQEMVAQVRAMHRALGITSEEMQQDPAWQSFQEVRKVEAQWKASEEVGGRRRMLRWGLGIAAAIGLLLLGIWLGQSSSQPDWEAIAQNEFEAYPQVFGGDLVRSPNPDSAAFIQMIRWYREQTYDSTLLLMNDWLAKYPDTTHLGIASCEIQFYRGQTLWQLRQPIRAIADWRNVLQANCKRFVPEAEWYLAIGYLGTERPDSARYFFRVIQQAEDHPYSARSKRLADLLE